MKKTIATVWVSLVMLSLQAQTFSDPNAALRQVKNFTKIDLSSAFDVYITQASEEAVAVSAVNTEVREQISVEVKDGTLFIGFRSKKEKWSKGNKDLKAYISVKQLEKITASGTCNIFITDKLHTAKLTLNLSGACDLLGNIIATELNIDLSGASDLKLKGNTTTVKIDASGACRFDGFDLITENCTIDANGVANVKLTVNKELSVYASGASSIRYAGNGEVKSIHTSGTASIKKVK